VALAHFRRRRSPILAPPGVGVFAMRRLLLASLLAVACRPAADRPASATPAQRIVSLAPSATELLFALGAGDQVVGRTTWCRYPPEALRVPDVGDGLNPNIEAVVARRPDLVVLYRSELNEGAAAQLQRLGIRSIVLAQDRLEDVARAARLLGPLAGHARAGDSIAAAIERLLNTPPPTPRVRIAFVVWDNPPMVIGAGSYLDQLATLAGAANVFHDLRSASATVSLETIAARDPDAIVILSDSTAPPPYASRPEWRAIRAVRERRFVMLPAGLFGRPSPTAPAAVAALRRSLESEVPR
jgi:ABC-type Fe3+-hydroxamate transport system substrate-binding protein